MDKKTISRGVIGQRFTLWVKKNHRYFPNLLWLFKLINIRLNPSQKENIETAYEILKRS
jgi:hypothetical protein